jgi:hypothetical protein
VCVCVCVCKTVSNVVAYHPVEYRPTNSKYENGGRGDAAHNDAKVSSHIWLPPHTGTRKQPELV